MEASRPTADCHEELVYLFMPCCERTSAYRRVSLCHAAASRASLIMYYMEVIIETKFFHFAIERAGH